MENTPARLSAIPGFPWKIFWVLTLGCLLGFAAGMPYIYALFRDLVARTPLAMPLPVLITVQLMQSTFVFGGIVALGLVLARKVGIEMLILHGWLYGRSGRFPDGWLRSPVLAGLGLGLAVLLGYRFVFLPLIPTWPLQAEAALPAWKRFLVCLYTGIDIELVMRLFLLSFFLWLLQFFVGLLRRSAGSSQLSESHSRPSAVIFWTANVIVALIYALGHLPAAKSVMELTPIVIAAVAIPTGLSAIAFGYFAWKRGIEAAILAHFSADVVLHLVGPIFFRG
jgi:hypothetical protein